MKSGGPWNIKGLLRPEAREAAREAARQSGLSVGEWLNNVIETNGEVDEEPGPPPDYRHTPAREEPRRERQPRRDEEAAGTRRPPPNPRQPRAREPPRRERQPRRDEEADDHYRNGADRYQSRH